MRKAARSLVTVCLFVFFGLGGVVLSYVVLPFVRGRAAGQRAVRGIWRFLVRVFEFTRLVSVEASGLESVHGRIIAANHPSLIDVVLLTALIPDVYSVAKSGLKENPFIGRVVGKVMIANDGDVLQEARKILAAGGNILVFPEGTRTPLDGGRLKLRRGAAQMAIRLGVPVVPVRIEMSRRILAKSQPITDMGERTVEYRLFSGREIPPPALSAANRSAAVAVTGEIEKFIFD